MRSAVLCAVLSLCSLLLPWGAQAVTPEEASKISTAFGNRVEAATILGGNDSASGGVYDFSANKANINIFKIAGHGDVTAPMSLGESGLSWNPILGGSIGYIQCESNLNFAPYIGNRIQNHSFFSSLGGGGRLWFTKELSTSASATLLYTHFTNTITSQTSGIPAAADSLLDWNADTITAIPSVDIRYRIGLTKDLQLEFTSLYSHFATWQIDNSSPDLNVSGASDTWANKLDLDQRLPWKLLGYNLHTGGFFSVMNLFGSAADGFDASAIYTGNIRLVVGDIPGIWKAWFVNWLGLGASYFWAGSFSGWSYGADVKFVF